MTITLEIPEELAAQLGNSPQELSRHALEALVLEAYREDRIGSPAGGGASRVLPTKVESLSERKACDGARLSRCRPGARRGHDSAATVGRFFAGGMSIVIVDTSPINYLLVMGYAELLPRIYGHIILPESVLAELHDEKQFGNSWDLGPLAAGMRIRSKTFFASSTTGGAATSSFFGRLRNRRDCPCRGVECEPAPHG